MNTLTLDSTVGDIVRADFRTAAVFQEHALDFCCGGGQTLQAACAKKGIDAAAVIDEIARVTAERDPNVPAFDAWDLDVLIQHIISTHHEYVKRMLPVVRMHADKVAHVHGERHPENIRIAELFAEVHNELEHHLFKEEQVLFPYINRLARAKRNEASFEGSHFGSVRNPINMMEFEHEHAGHALAEIRSLGNNLTPPEDACETYKVLYKELDEFERDLHRHIHLENNILHPKAIALEEELVAATA